MSGSLNRAQIIGNLGQDPDVRHLEGGRKVVQISVATSDRWKDKATGDQKERTEWHRVIIWNEGLAGVAEKYLRKGSKVFIEGKLQTRAWEKDGKTHYTTEIVLQAYNGTLTLLDRAGSGNRPPPSDGEPDGPGVGSAAGAGSRPKNDLDDEIPF